MLDRAARHSLRRATTKYTSMLQTFAGPRGMDEQVACAKQLCFVAYLTARGNLRSEFTVSGQQRAFDEIAAMLLARCKRARNTNWFVIAHVHPRAEVLAQLTAEQKLALLVVAFELLGQIAELLRGTWERSNFDRASMVVHRGDDSTTRNTTASAWNKAREFWIALLYAMGMDGVLDGMCVGKVMRLRRPRGSGRRRSWSAGSRSRIR